MLGGQVITGATSSAIVTVATHVAVLPLLSVTVNVTSWTCPLDCPASTPATGFCVTLAIVQLSLATSDAAMSGITSSQSFTVTLDGQAAITGAITSSTVTVATQTLVLPEESTSQRA
jgi:hypothetical protein